MKPNGWIGYQQSVLGRICRTGKFSVKGGGRVKERNGKGGLNDDKLQCMKLCESKGDRILRGLLNKSRS